jgi:DNA-binding transcriptional LysR family regulator
LNKDAFSARDCSRKWSNRIDKLQAIKGFVRIVESGSLTAAAADLNVSLPSMVRRLAALEHDLGVTLLNRTTRRIHLTHDGEQYLEHCRMILTHVQEAEGALRSRRAVPHGRLGLTASVAFGQRHMASIVNEFVRRHPNVNVEFLLVNRIVNLIEEGFDVAIRIAHLDDTSLVSIPLTKVRRVVCASPDYLRQHGIPRHPQDLQAHRGVRFTGLAPRAHWPFRINFRDVSVPIPDVVVCNDADVAIESCAKGLGLGSFLSYMVAPLIKSARLKYVLADFEIEPVPVRFVYPRSRIMSATVRAFAELCVNKLQSVSLD